MTTKERHPSEMSDDELVENLKLLVREEQLMTAKAIADVYAGNPVDPFVLDLLRGELDDEEVDALEEANERAHARAGRRRGVK